MIIFPLFAAIGKVLHGNSDDEIKLIKGIRAHDADALEELYELYNQLLFGIVLSIVKKRPIAEDVLQEVFVNIWSDADSFDEDRGNVYGWLVTLARNKAIGRIRSKEHKTRQETSESIQDPFFTLEDDIVDPLETTIFSNRAELVKKALQELPETQSQVIKIAYYRGAIQAEIADHLGIPLDTVKIRTREGMMKLKRILETYIK
ncbi:MAG TPA: sigma-70 family RNA polymerase sigma factor [Fodinibius sp.]|nr:sigma-70 family RNA polymerase sigma factor [Fodinibius sp.]